MGSITVSTCDVVARLGIPVSGGAGDELSTGVGSETPSVLLLQVVGLVPRSRPALLIYVVRQQWLYRLVTWCWLKWPS